MFVGEIERYRQGITYREDPHVDVDTRIRKRRALVLGPNPLTGFLLLTSFPSRHLPIEYGMFCRIFSFVSFYLFSKKKGIFFFLDFGPSPNAKHGQTNFLGFLEKEKKRLSFHIYSISKYNKDIVISRKFVQNLVNTRLKGKKCQREKEEFEHANRNIRTSSRSSTTRIRRKRERF